MSTTYKPLYTASGTYTISPENVASSSTFTAGVESNAVSNISSLYDDLLVSGLWTAGTTPTANTQVQAWVVPPLSDDLNTSVTWPDVFDGTASAETVTSAGVLYGLGTMLQPLSVDAATSNRSYYKMPESIAVQRFGWRLPSRHVLFVAHNSVATSNSTAGNHAWYYLPLQDQGV